jgi:ABC-2 type transport system permease protein
MTIIHRHSRIVALESWYEIVKLFRTTAFIVPTLTFPLMFYLFFGIAMGGRMRAGGLSLDVYLIATYGAFGVIMAALSSFGAGVAVERGQGTLRLKHATPMPLYAYIIAKLAAALLISALIVTLLLVVGMAASNVRIGMGHVATLFATLIGGTVPFALLGLTIGYVVSAQASVAVLNLVSMPMALLSGLWIPIDALPRSVQNIATYLPGYHLGQLALGAIEMPSRGTAAGHITTLVGFTLIFFVTAIAAYRLERRRNYA